MFKIIGFVLVALLLALVSYAALGYVSGSRDADQHRQMAQTLIETGKGADALGPKRIQLLLLVQDPAFHNHEGVDLKTAGAGLTTITQSVSKRLAFENFKPGIGKIKQTTYAISLERHLTKNEILALFLDTVPMGQGSNGWTVGFFDASQSFYGMSPRDLNDNQFIELVSVMIAPGLLNHKSRNEKFTERVKRIERLHKGECHPKTNKDVWFEACASKN